METNRADREWIARISEYFGKLATGGTVLSFRRGQTVFYEEHHPLGVFILCEGKIHLSRKDDASFSCELSSELVPIIGMDYLLSETTYGYSAEARTDIRVCFIPKTQILKSLERAGAAPLHVAIPKNKPN